MAVPSLLILDTLAQLKFNPLLCESYKNFSLCKDNDPDVNFYFKTVAVDSFNNMLAENHIRLNLKCMQLS